MNLLTINELDILLEKKKSLKYALSECKDKYSKWYQKRIIEKKIKGKWTVNRGLYNWWLKKLLKVQQ